MNSLRIISVIDELSLLIDKQVSSILLTEAGWLIVFTDQSKVMVSSKIPLMTVIIAGFACDSLRGIPIGFEELIDLVKVGGVNFVEIIKENDNKIRVSISGREVFLVRDARIFEPQYSLQEFFEEVGPNVQKFATGRSLAPLPRRLFMKRAHEVIRLSRSGDFDAIISLPPLIITVGITDLCNFKCEMCFRTRGNYVQGSYVFPEDTLRKLIMDMASIGVKGLRFCGEGENMLHSQFLETLMLAKVVGLRTFMITNGTMLGRGYRICSRCLDYLRVSFNALTPESYRRVHGIGSEKTYFAVLDGLKAVKVERDSLNRKVPIISMSCVILASNIEEGLRGRLANDLNGIGLDFLVMKSDRIWEMSPQDKERYFDVVKRFEEFSIRVTDYSGLSGAEPIIIRDWEQELGLGCIVRLTRANIDKFNVHSCVTEHETYGVITEHRLPVIWASNQRSALQYQRSKSRLNNCDRCFWGDFHRIMNYLFEQEMNCL